MSLHLLQAVLSVGWRRGFDARRLASPGVALHTDSKLCFSRPGGC
jgi:hypothetical protein